MLGRFLKDRRGNYAMMMAVMTIPIMGSVALAVDYTQMVRYRHAALNALDAAAIATARRAVEGATEQELLTYAKDFFEANLGGIKPGSVELNVVLPTSDAGGGTIKMSAKIGYEPHFLPAFTALMSSDVYAGGMLNLDASTEVQLKNTLEVALVLDNSGSMDINGTGTGKKRLVLLKEAAKQLVETIAQQAGQIKQVDEPVRFSVVPFAASVNVGTQHATASWMDVDGRSPVHHENFDWTTMPTSHSVQQSGGVFYKTGNGWGAQKGQKVTRFTLFNDLKRITAVNKVKTGTTWGCIQWNWWGNCTAHGWVDVFEDVPVLGQYASWAGCVETRPHPYAYDITAPSSGTPATLFVPMFAPDETDRLNSNNRRAMGNWWADQLGGTDDYKRQSFMPKYFEPAPLGTNAVGMYAGPNAMCSTTPITPLTDVSTAAGLKKVKDAIDAMVALGATDIPEGTAWGWRTVSSKAPFTEGRPDSEKGNDKVVIVLTDGFNTYYTPGSLGYNDLAGNKSIYSNQGYTGRGYGANNNPRIFMNTNVNKVDHSNGNFTAAMNQHLDSVCNQAKAAGVILMTVALDLSEGNKDEKDAIEAMRRCASDSRFRRDPSNPSAAAKLFWNANGSNLAEKFKEIADELSNLRIIG